jgi:hypothetical protein
MSSRPPERAPITYDYQRGSGYCICTCEHQTGYRQRSVVERLGIYFLLPAAYCLVHAACDLR